MGKSVTKRTRGRPKLLPADRKRNNLTLRLRDESKAMLEEAARKNQRSLSEEAEAGLERTMILQSNINEGLSLKYGPAAAGLLRLMGEAMMEAGFQAVYETTKKTERLRDWPLNPAAFEAAKQAAIGILNSAAPSPPTTHEKEARTWGQSMAMAVISLLKDPSGAPLYEKDNREIAAMLGPIFEKITVKGVKSQ